MSLKQIILQWVERFNAMDVDALAAMYSDDAINHQIPEKAVHGREAIRRMFEKEFKTAEMVCRVELIICEGEWAVLEWSDPNGLRGCGFFHITDGLIVEQRGYWDKLSFLRVQGKKPPRF